MFFFLNFAGSVINMQLSPIKLPPVSPKYNKKSYHMFKHVIIGGVMKLVGIEACTNRT